MAKRYPLDTRIAIAEAFDTGRLRGECTVNEIAEAVGANRKSVGRTLKVMAFRLVRKPSPLRTPIPNRWSPPRNFPKLPRPSAVTKGILALYDSGQWAGRCYARDLANLMDVPEKSVAHGLRRLKFKVVKRAYLQFVRMDPAVWAPPPEWPPVLRKQRQLHRSGLSTGAVMRATELSAEVTAIIDDAVRRLDIADVPLYRPGAMKAKIKEVVQDVYRRATYDNVSREQLASWLMESPDVHVGAMESRIKGLVRFATSKTCPECGHNPARGRQIANAMPQGAQQP